MSAKVERTSGFSRADAKRKTRRSIIEAALKLSAKNGFSSLSLREVARQAGIAPNGFYSHFQDLEELRLTIIDEAGMTLRNVMRQVLKRKDNDKSIVRVSVETFLEYLESNGDMFRMLIATRSGGSKAGRRAVYKDINRFFSDLIEYIELDSREKGRYMDKVPEVAHAVTNIVFNGSLELLDLPGTDRQALAERLIQEVRLVTLGAEALAAGWKPEAIRERV